MDYAILAAELQQAQYAGMTDAEIAAALNALPRPTRRRVPISELQARAMEAGVYTALRVAVGNEAAPAELRAVAQTVLDLANARFDDVDLDNAASRQMFGALQQAGVITAQQAEIIYALATVPGVSRADVLGLGVVAEEDIKAARDWQAYEELRRRIQAGAAIAAGWLIQQRNAGAPVPEWDTVLEHV